MARRSATGQLNMFDLFSNIEPGEVQMVSLMPEDEPEIIDEPKIINEPEIIDEPEPKVVRQVVRDNEAVAMSRTYEIYGEKIEIAYMNYNKVRITKGKNAPEIKVFETSKEAVDYYVEKMQELESDEE